MLASHRRPRPFRVSSEYLKHSGFNWFSFSWLLKKAVSSLASSAGPLGLSPLKASLSGFAISPKLGIHILQNLSFPRDPTSGGAWPGSESSPCGGGWLPPRLFLRRFAAPTRRGGIRHRLPVLRSWVAGGKRRGNLEGSALCRRSAAAPG